MAGKFFKNTYNWLVVTGTWPWKIPYKWRFLAGKIIYSYIINHNYLLGGLEYDFFPYIGNVIIPTDELIFQRGRYTTNQDLFRGRTPLFSLLQMEVLPSGYLT